MLWQVFITYLFVIYLLMVIFTEFMTVPLITTCPCLFLRRNELFMYWNFYHTIQNLRTMGRVHTPGLCTVLYDTLLPVEGHCLSASIAVQSKTKCSSQEKTHSQESAMCLTTNSVFELYDSLEGSLSLFFFSFFFLWSGITC